MLNYAYANFGGYFWMIAIAAITYLVMTVVRKTFTPISKKLAQTEKERRFANALLGIVLSVAIGYAVGKFGNFLFASNVYFMWFVGGGLLANYANLLVHKYQGAEASAFAKAFINAMNESNMDVSEDDLPVLTEQIGVIVKAYADNNEKAIAKLKSAGIDTTIIDAAFAKAKADGKITRDEKADLEAVIRAIHKVTNI